MSRASPPRTVLLVGATGFLGRALTLALRRDGHRVVARVRSVERARALLGDQAELAGEDASLEELVARCDAVVNLAGESILARWTNARRAALRASRVELTQRVVDAISRATRRPEVLISASAVGVYGDRGDERLEEASAPGSGFLAALCAEWEVAALRAEGLGVRVVLARTGIVLGLDGGALPTMLLPFRLGLGGRLGSGRQFMPWIHVEDWVRMLVAALADTRFRGPLNVVAPEPVSNRDFTRQLASVLRRPAIVPVPRLALRALFGGGASILVEGQRAPALAQSLGFEFRFATLAAALRDLLVDGRPRITPVARAQRTGLPSSPHLGRRRPAYELRNTTELGVPVAEAFRFFSAPENLGLLTPRAMRFAITSPSGAPAAGSTIDYRIRVGPLPLRWRTRFEAWDEGVRFVDVQEQGPYRCWWHEHRFEPTTAGTRMQDRVLYAPPLGLLGRLAQPLLIADQLGDIFAQRALAIRLRFGGPVDA